jgi:tetratricopeptide (TPR) repeat protein
MSVVPLALGIGTAAVHAQDDDEDKRKYEDIETQQRQAVGRECGAVLEDVQTITEEEKWQQALNTLQTKGRNACQTSYEKSQVSNFLGYVFYSLERYQDAIRAYTNMVNEPEADPKQAISTRYTIAQLYMIIEDYANAARQLEIWMEQSPIVGSDAKVLLAQAYYQVDRKNDSLRLVEEAINEQEAKGNLPKESWWSLQRVLYYEKNDYRKVVDILKKLIRHYPSFSYWRQLGGMYGELGAEMNQLVATEMPYLAGEMDQERQLLSLAYMYMGASAPYRGARIIEEGMQAGQIERNAENLEVLGMAWQQAQSSDKALPVLEQAAQKSGEGEIYSRLAGVYLDLDQNEKAVAAARNAVRRGDLKRTGMTYMNLGSALVNLHCYDDAIKAFRQSAKYDDSKKYATRWIQYAEKEGERRAKLIESGADIATCQI